jgi:hypothetical protein
MVLLTHTQSFKERERENGIIHILFITCLIVVSVLCTPNMFSLNRLVVDPIPAICSAEATMSNVLVWMHELKPDQIQRSSWSFAFQASSRLRRHSQSLPAYKTGGWLSAFLRHGDRHQRSRARPATEQGRAILVWVRVLWSGEMTPTPDGSVDR